MDWAKYWWQSVGGAHDMVLAAASALYFEKSVVIADFVRMPWSDIFCDFVEREYYTAGGSREIQYVIASDVDEPSNFLFSLLSSTTGYRPTQEQSAYIKNSGELRDRIFWVKDIVSEKLGAWCRLCKELAGALQFVFEISDDVRQVSGTEHIFLDRWVREYDYSIFALAAAFSRNDCQGVRTCRYIAELACMHHKRDAVKILDFALGFPPDADPCENGLPAKLVWRAQLRTAFHIIEEERLKFVDRYREAISDCLPQTQYDELIDEPENVELKLLLDLSKRSHPAPRLNLSYDEREWLKFLYYTSRNSLAHGKTLAPSDISRLFAM